MTDRVLGAYVRGRLFMAGVTDATDLGDALDVLTVVLMDTPGEALGVWRRRMDLVTAQAQARSGRVDRASWGLRPEQVQQQKQAMRTLGEGR